MASGARPRAPIDYGDVDLRSLAERIHSNIRTISELVLDDVSARSGGIGQLPVIVIAGPTGVGKSELAELVARGCGAHIVSADSMQVYRHMDIGTAKVAPGDRGVPYHCIDMVDPGEAYSAALYQRDARAAIDSAWAEGANVVVCGGTGLYIRAALDDMEFPKGEQVGNPVRERYERYADENGADALHGLLEERDPESAALIHPHNVRRVVRALEMLEGGCSYAEQSSGMGEFVPFIDAVYIGLTMEVPNLYAAIDSRVDGMMEAGLLDEVRWLVDNGYRDAMTSMQAIGYKELVEVIDGRSRLDEAVDAIKRGTRRYSKRQRTWFRRDPRYVWYAVDSGDGELVAGRP